MTVPIHNLYDFVHLLTKKQYLLMYHYPFGSRDLSDVCSQQIDMNRINGPLGIEKQDLIISKFLSIDQIDRHYIHKTQPIMFCHDQEPLNFDLYTDDSEYVKSYHAILENDPIYISTQNSCFNNSNLRWAAYTNIQKSWTLLHSELNSDNLGRYEETGRFVGAYWWSHAILARDWYRFAEYDTTLTPSPTPKKLFLTYCRATSGSREYRKDFLKQIKKLSLQEHCQFKSFDGNKVGSDASAVYNTYDFNSTAISVILETVFDNRIHLTEKVLRPIACGHPFMLAAGPGSLQLLRKYGFKTFDQYIDESYDTITDSNKRLNAVVDAMKKFQLLDTDLQNAALKECRRIAKFNQHHFFSKDFLKQVTDELVTNVDTAWQKHRGELDLEFWWNTLQWYKKNGHGPVFSKEHRRLFSPMHRINRV